MRPHHQANYEWQAANRRFSHVFRWAGHRFSAACRLIDRHISRPVRPVGSPGDRRLKMNAIDKISPNDRYARCVQTSKRVRWDIDKDVIRGRQFDTAHKFLPDGLSLVDAFTTLSADEKRFVSQIQGRTYANIFGLVERFINAKVLELSHDHWFGDQVALEALVRFSDEELKHQDLFRRIDKMVGEVLPLGYRFDIDPNGVARAVLGKSTWAVLTLTLDIELFTQLHYRQSIDPDTALSELFKDIFLYHWKEESQHAILDELEWVHHDAELTPEERDRGCRGASDRDRIPQGLPLAIHPFRRRSSAVRQGAFRTDHRRPGPAHSG